MSFKSQDDNKNSFDVATTEKDFRLSQDLSAYKDYAAQQREIAEHGKVKSKNYKPFCIIPDIVAIDMLTRFKLDIHAPDFMSNPVEVAKFKRLMFTEYPHLLTSNIKQ